MQHNRRNTVAATLVAALAITLSPVRAEPAPAAGAPTGAPASTLLAAQGLTQADLEGTLDITSPAMALRALKVGNARYYTGHFVTPDVSAVRRLSQKGGQNPFAIVLGCADSRTPPELLFDQGLGDIFGIRVAGNIAEPATLGSVEYAVAHLKPQLIVVMGHQACGAVRAALAGHDPHGHTPANVETILAYIRPATDSVVSLGDASVREKQAILNNVRLQVDRLSKNPVVAEAYHAGKLWIVGAYYDIETGAVTFLEFDGNVRAAFLPPAAVVAPTSPAAHYAAPAKSGAAARPAPARFVAPAKPKPAAPAHATHGHGH